MKRRRNACIFCLEDAITTVGGHAIVAKCLARIRAIATDAGVVIDEGLLGGTLRTLKRRALSKAERKLEDQLERRAIAAARRSA